jgi:predicted esterase
MAIKGSQRDDMKFKCLCVLFLILVFEVNVFAQVERYELGRRLRKVEAELETAPQKLRKSAFAEIKKAVDGFFTFRFSEVARSLDKAYLVLMQREDEQSLWAESLSVLPEYRFLDRKDTELKVMVSAFYQTLDTIPQKATLQLSLTNLNGKLIKRFQPLSIKSLPISETIKLEKIKAGDFYLRAEILIDGKVSSENKIIVSISDNLEQRLKNLEKRLESNKDGWQKETALEYLRILQKLKQGETLEIDFQADGILKKAEILAFTPEKFRIQSEQSLVAIPLKDGVQVSRVFLPNNYGETKAFPLVIALHGAGGSENLFFEGYGNGKIVRLCQERNWILVAPRNFGFKATRMQEFIESLSGIYKIDKSKVFLVGHSLGSIQALTIASEKPWLFRAIALVSAGGTFRDNEELKNLPVLIATGTADFSLRNSKSLQEKMKQAGFTKTKFIVYEDVEHLTVVQFSLDDIFAFFESTLL